MIFKLLLNMAALYITSYLVSGVRHKNTFSLFVMALAIGLLNVFIRPFLFILTIPFTILTYGLFLFVLNGIIFWLAAKLVKDYDVDNIWSGIKGWIVYSLFAFAFEMLFL